MLVCEEDRKKVLGNAPHIMFYFNLLGYSIKCTTHDCSFTLCYASQRYLTKIYLCSIFPDITAQPFPVARISWRPVELVAGKSDPHDLVVLLMASYAFGMWRFCRDYYLMYPQLSISQNTGLKIWTLKHNHFNPPYEYLSENIEDLR